jgi:hypothetical protein
MKRIDVKRAVLGGTKLARAGRTLVIFNVSSLVIPNLTRDSGAPVTAATMLELNDILIGFDRTPHTGDAEGIAPAEAITTIPVPEGVTNVHLAYNSGEGLEHAGSTAGVARLMYEWQNCEAPASIVPTAGLLPLGGSTGIRHFTTGQQLIVPPRVGTPIMDPGFATNKPTWLRPMIPPNIVDTVRAVTVINTLFSMLGPNAWLAGWTGSKLVHRIYVSVSADTLVVIGSDALTVGAPGAGERFRGVIRAAAQPFPIDFGEGMEVDTDGGTGWKAYTAVAVTFDATIFGG